MSYTKKVLSINVNYDDVDKMLATHNVKYEKYQSFYNPHDTIYYNDAGWPVARYRHASKVLEIKEYVNDDTM